jgi:transketolase
MSSNNQQNTGISLKAADNIRILAAAMVEKAKSGHPGGPMGGADFIHVLYSQFLRFDPSDMTWPLRDRFYLDAGHMSAMLYASQTLLGKYTLDDIKNFRQWGSPTPGHPELDLQRGIENTSGPLGLGHAFGIGAAIAERFLAARFGEELAHKTYIYISDGGVQEEISQGAGRIAGYLGLGNIIMFYDANDIQLSTRVDEVTTEDTAKKYEAWGWHVLTIDGNDHQQIAAALQAGIDEAKRPTIIIGKTVMGKGVIGTDGQPYESEVELHGQPISNCAASFEKTIANLGGNPEEPFRIFDDVATHYADVLKEKQAAATKRKDAFALWATQHPDLAGKFRQFYSGTIPALDWTKVVQKPNIATRAASGAVLSFLADNLENMIVASADLSNSDKTDSFLKKTKPLAAGDFSGAFLNAGVSELTMAALATGMALHGGVIPVCATFFAFSDYMKPVLRMAALMKQSVKFIWTHDAFRVGEDGPTHQPVEQEAQLRLLEQLKNHSGKPSLLALRPADAHETTICWQMILENTESPSGLILTRQNVNSLPAGKAEMARKGAYIVSDCDGKPDVILLANGSEVATLVSGAEILQAEKGLKIRIVSAPSEGLFRLQSKDYQASVLPPDVPTFGLTAGLPSTLRGLIPHLGRVWGMESFGQSAPFKVLDEKFGFTPENVYKQVLDYLAGLNQLPGN